MSILNQYRVYCIDEATFVTGWLQDPQVCTQCFNNSSHTVNPNSISIIETISPNTTLISTQAIGETNGNYRREGKVMNIAAGPNVITSQNTSFPYDIGILAFILSIGQDNIGDQVDVVVMPINNYPIGLLAANVTAGQTVIPIPIGTLNYLQIGFNLTLQSATTGILEEEQEIISINSTNSTITLQTGITSAFSIGDYISFVMTRCKNIYLNSPGNERVGDFLRTALFPKTMQAQLRYKNNSNSAKVFSYASDYLF